MSDNQILTNLIKDNKKLICSIISKYTKYYEFDDLYQVSTIGIIKAYQNYDKSYEVKFTTYAYKYILSEVLSFIRNSKLIKMSRDYHKVYKKILEARNLLTQKLMKEPSLKDIANFLEIDEALINEVIKYQESGQSLDESINQDGKTLTLLDQVASTNNMDLDYISLKDELNNLPNDEYNLINLRYFYDKTQEEVATLLGTNQVNVSRTEKKILKKLSKVI